MSASVLQNMAAGCSPPQRDGVPRVQPPLVAEVRGSEAQPRGIQRAACRMASEVQTRCRWGRLGRSKPTADVESTNQQEAEGALATCPASDQELGIWEASGKSLEFGDKPRPVRSSRARPPGQLRTNLLLDWQ